MEFDVKRYVTVFYEGEGIVAASIKSNELVLLTEILRLGLSPNEHEDYNMSALSVACKYGNLAAISILLNFGATVHGTPYEDSAPIYYAIMRDDVEAVCKLLENGASVEYTPSNEGAQPFTYAMSAGMKALMIRALSGEVGEAEPAS